MNGSATPKSAAIAISALRWWQDAGVDTLVGERPLPWREHRPAAEVSPAPRVAAIARSDRAPPPVAAVADAALPATLPALVAWLASAPGIAEAAPPAQRIPASGNPAADLLIVIDMPALGDVEAGRLLAREVGDMFDRMLAAIGRDRDSCYIATLCPSRTPTAQLLPASQAPLGRIARHHIALAAPDRVWLMGDAVSRAILGMEMLRARGRLHRIKDVEAKVQAVVSYSPLVLHRNPRLKADAWADMQMLRRGTEA